MKILITNDDGIFSPGLAMMAETLKNFGEVFIVCPNTEKSAISHSVTLRTPLKLAKVDFSANIEAWTVNGTPADCIKLGMEVIMQKPPDIVFSGINIGPNAGRDIYYSGTMAGASESLLYGVPAVSVSAALPPAETAGIYTIQPLFYEVAEEIMRRSIPKGVFLNINLPYKTKECCKGIRVVEPDFSVSRYQLVSLNDPYGELIHWLKDDYEDLENLLPNSEYQFLKDGYITISPIAPRFSWKGKIDQLSGWFTDLNSKQETTA